MSPKSFVALFAAILVSASARQLENGTRVFETSDEELKLDPLVLNLPRGVKCNMSDCSVPCPGSRPPPFCPKNLDCPLSGCACIFICPNRWVCYETRYCKDFRRYLTKMPFIPRITPENFNYYPF